ncbi:hypothetical protein VIGAN_10090700 [Vigna angularis var. angularis]|uniref:Uncharacterized protein n=1 Tax=Vigna angularis var. angularis TaxID=157739 RepID=A0A0S3T2Y7_PHAAN|nr:hypothetical protein VIGAN_10090700 [Vigna angularis var. angularis]
MMADEGFGYAWFLDGDGSAANDNKFCIDLETVMSVLDKDIDPSKVLNGEILKQRDCEQFGVY